jgi:hypothetical protein
MKPSVDVPAQGKRTTSTSLAPPGTLASAAGSGADARPVAPRPAARAYTLAHRTVSSVSVYLSRRAQYIGRTGIVGVSLLVFAVAAFLGANVAQRLQLANLRADLLAAQQAAAARHLAGPDLSGPEALRTFVRRLPARSELPAIMEGIVKQAAAAGVALERGSYAFTVTRSGQIVRYRMTFPVVGAYPNIRSFIDGTLAVIPNAAVDGLKLERKNIGAGEVEADIRFAVFARNET